METIKIFCNNISGGWEPEDIESGIGGSEEAIILISEEFAKHDYLVIIYYPSREVLNKKRNQTSEKIFKEVIYLDRTQAQCSKDDIFITWKDNSPWENSAKGKLNIHWTAEVENPWNYKNIDHYICISNFHINRSVSVPDSIIKYFPLGIDKENLTKNKSSKNKNQILYSDSPDRGLEPVLYHWPQIQKNYPDLKLITTYGFDTFDKFNNSLQSQQYKNMILEGLKQPNISNLGRIRRSEMEKLYWQSEYWILPLIVPDSQLNSLNAQKAQFCGCKPVINQLGALPELVNEFINFDDFVKGDPKILKSSNYKIMDWKEVVEKYWLKLFREHK